MTANDKNGKSWELDAFVDYLDQLDARGQNVPNDEIKVAVSFVTRLAALYKANRGFAKAAPGDIVNIGQGVNSIKDALLTVLGEAKTDNVAVVVKLSEQCPIIERALKGILASLDKIADDNNLPR